MKILYLGQFILGKAKPNLNLTRSGEHIDLIVPVFNPPENWTEVIKSNIQELKPLIGYTIHPTIVCDGGLDRMQQADLDALESELDNCTIVIYETNAGKGHAIREGLKNAESGLVIYTDVDFPYTSSSFLKIFESLKAGHDVACGTRSEEYYTHVPWLRRVVSKLLRRMIRFIIRIPVSDTQCGLKGFNEKGKAVFLETQIDRFLFDLEFIKLSSKRKLSIDPVPVTLKPGVEFSKTRLAILIRESFNFLRVLFR